MSELPRTEASEWRKALAAAHAAGKWPKMTFQKARHSLLETCLNTLSGFLASLAATALIFPSLGIQSTPSQNFQVTAIFTVMSVIRSYIWRRVFNRLHTTGRLG